VALEAAVGRNPAVKEAVGSNPAVAADQLSTAVGAAADTHMAEVDSSVGAVVVDSFAAVVVGSFVVGAAAVWVALRSLARDQTLTPPEGREDGPGYCPLLAL
jgi:hypothetical protein